MLTVSRMYIFIALSLLLSACTLYGDKEKEINNEPGALDLILCENPRPEMCTRDYRPVCATLQNKTSKTYSNACTSCSDSAVKAYQSGACG